MTTHLTTKNQINALRLASTLVADAAVLSGDQCEYLQQVLKDKAQALEKIIVEAGAIRILTLMYPDFYVDDQNVRRVDHIGYKHIDTTENPSEFSYTIVYNIFNLEAHRAYGSPATVFGSTMEMTVPTSWIHLDPNAAESVLWGFIQDAVTERKTAAQMIQDQQLMVDNALTTLATLQSTLRDLKAQHSGTELSVRRTGAIVKDISCSS